MPCNLAATNLVASPSADPSFDSPSDSFRLQPEPLELCPDAETTALRAAAILALSKGWYIFAARPRTKSPYRNTKRKKSLGKKDWGCSNDPKKALLKWK